jgi:hypothetical protein
VQLVVLVLVDELAKLGMGILPIRNPSVAILDACDGMSALVPSIDVVFYAVSESFLVERARLVVDGAHNRIDRIGVIQYVLKHDLDVLL